MRAFSSLIVAAATLLPAATASIIPHLLRSFEELQDVRKRCDNPCGWEGKLCCGSGEICYTDNNNQAQCGAGNVVAGVSYITSTYVLVNSQTITTTIAVQATGSSNSCKYSIGETSCGSTCCNSEQFCESQENSKCKDTGSGSSGYYSSLLTVTTVITNTAEPPLRPTSDTLVTVTATGTAGGITTTQGFISPTGTIIAESSGGGGGGLSAGAIAGIVIGVLAAIIILILICLCCCAKGILDAILGIFGLGPRSRRKEKEVEIYESRHHHGSRRGRSVSAAPAKRTWYGTKVKQGSDYSEKKKSSGFGRATGVAAFLASLAIILGFKRSRDRKDHKSEVSYGSSYYSDYTSSEYSPQHDLDRMLTILQVLRAHLIEGPDGHRGLDQGHIRNREHQGDESHSEHYLQFW